jgi:hypothetical protein
MTFTSMRMMGVWGRHPRADGTRHQDRARAHEALPRGSCCNPGVHSRAGLSSPTKRKG